MLRAWYAMGARARVVCLLTWLGVLVTSALASGHVHGSTDLRPAPSFPQANDIFGVEPGMNLVEVRQALARRFPSAFSSCAMPLDSLRPLVCRVTAEAYYEEAVGRPLSPVVNAENPYISNIVLTVTESDAKRSIEVFFGSSASGREAYRISGITHYSPRAQPQMASYAAAFTDKYGPLEAPVARGRGTVATANFVAGKRVAAVPACQEMASLAMQLHDMRAMADRGLGRQLGALPCDSMISLSIAPGNTPAHVGVTTVVVFDAARLARLFDRESQAAAAANAALQSQPGPTPRRARDF